MATRPDAHRRALPRPAGGGAAPDHEPDEGLPPEQPAAERRAWLLSAGAAAVVVGLLAVLPGDAAPLYPAPWWLAVLVLAGFVASEPMVFHVEARNEAVSFSPSDIPLALGVLVLAPPLLLLVRLGAAAVALLHWRRPPPFKLVLNLAAFAVEAAVAAFVLRLLHPLLTEVDVVLWAAVAASLVVGLVAGGMTIAVAISFFEGDAAARVRREVSHAGLFYLPGALLGATVAVPYLVEPWLALVFVLPVPVVWSLLRSHGSLMHQLVDLSQIHAFSSQVGRSAHLDDIASIAVAEVAGHLRAGRVGLVVFGSGARGLEVAVGDGSLLEVLPHRADDPVWADALRPGSLVAAGTGDTALDRRLAEVEVEHALVVALGGEHSTIGVLVVADRHGASSSFDEHDEDRLRPLSQQLSVALRKGQLHVQIQHEALHDPLTGLPNRAYFDAWSAQLLADGGEGPAAFLMVDLDRFKEVNDTFGHGAGDQLLVEVCRRLGEVVDDDALVARLGGDEFAVVVTGEASRRTRALVDAISATLEQPIDLDGTTVAIAGSIGVARVPEDGTDVQTVMRCADLAMYDAKQRHERAVFYRPELASTDSGRLSLLGDLRSALATDAIEVHYQPLVDVVTGRVRAVEALARWDHPEEGAVAPEVFVSLAEQSGLIATLTQHVLRTALVDVRDLADGGVALGVSVNVSATSLHSEAFTDLVAAELAAADVPPERLTLEITERAMIGDSPRTIAVIEELHALGVRLSVDDFGTGYSSLVTLRNLPIAELKIDRSFVSGMATAGTNDEVIVASTIDLGHNLGMSVIAEGVETAPVAGLLVDAGCDVVQGHGICPPLPRAALEHQLARGVLGPAAPRPRPRAA